MASKQRSHLLMKTVQASSPIEVLSNTFWHLFRISVSFALLFADNTILVTALILARLQYVADRYHKPRHDLPFYPKTVLITGIDVADLDLPIRSGGSMSRTLLTFYRVPKDHYISRILDIVHREKVDVWIPCSPKATAIEDATARQVIESRTSCKCIAFDTDLATRFLHTDSFAQFLTERNLPVVERHQVNSRDSIHKILHRSPSKSYQIQRLGSSSKEAGLLLPKRTLSKTYSEVSEIQINQNYPWILQQQTRLGEFYADILVIRGHVHAIKVRLAKAQKPHWGASPLDEALATAIHRLMQSFAVKGGARMTGHLSVRLLVDEEFDHSSVRHTIHIADCVPGAAAAENLVRDATCPVAGYLAVLAPEPTNQANWEVVASLSPTPRPGSRLIGIESEMIINSPLAFFPFKIAKRAKALMETEAVPFIFWSHPLFSFQDPFPWWWHVHVYQPLREIWLLMKQIREIGIANGSLCG
ncbi:hypothetical protein N7533_010163 [Penicillium manginii]|uniref:uncharacterized protein n=1 Tax=Penicillium manginii TaxID=203109 RepID=UPI002546E4DA|nr:uncharacterized protein N7533_010163 [Penicillium manginii]KAJ5743061.1 hypothetical protein N7533_010163 [Penicillium manginii]